MVDPKVQERFARRCTDAAVGYSTATTAAYVALAGQVFDFWAGVFAPEQKPKPQTPAWPQLPAWPQTPPWPNPFMGWPAVQNPAPVSPFSPFFWANAASVRPALPSAFPFAPGFSGANPFQAWFSTFPFASAPAAWPMAFMMIAYGMPSSVAWPTAEAHAAAIDAADAAAVTVRQAFSGYRTEGGHSARQWPQAQLMMFAAFLPIGLGAMLAQMRMP